jgi:Fic family protein
VRIHGAVHQPPSADEVPEIIGQMCEHVHQFWDSSPIHLASYVMWRTNWIHPFFGGNGRTARAASYLILCARLGFVLPGKKTIPDLIDEHREQYFRALQAADLDWETKKLDLGEMEKLLSALLAEQLLAVHELAAGEPPTVPPH